MSSPLTLPKPTRRAVAAGGALAVVASVGLGGPAARAATTPTPVALARQAVTDALARGSVRTVSTSRGKMVGRSVADVGLRSGVQTLSENTGEFAEIRLLGRTAYLAGNHAGLTGFEGLSSAQATRLGRRWLVLRYPSDAFVGAALDVNLPTTLLTSLPAGRLTELAPTTVDGQSVIPLRGAVPKIVGTTGTLTLYLSRGAKPLPVAETLTAKQYTAQTSFSRWGERVSVHAPSDTATLAQLKSGSR